MSSRVGRLYVFMVMGARFSVSDLLVTREVVILRSCSNPFIILDIESYIMMQIESRALLNFHAKGLS